MTEFYYYWKVVKKKLPLVLLVSVIAAVVALVVAKQVEPQQQVHFSYVISLSSRDPATEYRFDGYYALQATDVFAGTLAAWVTTPETIVAAYQEAGLSLPTDDPRALARVIRAEKSAPQLVMVTVKGAQREEAERLVSGLQRVMERNVAAYNTEGVPDVAFHVVVTEAWTGVTRVSVPIAVGATFLFAFLIALNAVILKESLKRS